MRHIDRSSAGMMLALMVLIMTGGILESRAREVPLDDPSAEAGLQLRSQTPQGVELHFGLGSFGMEPVRIGRATHQAITMPGVFLPNDAGAPDLPGVGRFIAIPQGAEARVEIVAARRQVYRNVPVAPAPVLPRENDDSPLIYERNDAIYGRDAFYPESPVRLSPPTMLRGVDVVTVGITPFQYNPVKRELIVYSDLDIRITFQGGNGHFGEDRLRSRHWAPILEGNLLNHASLQTPDSGFPEGERSGYEYVIICPNDAGFMAWADTLKAWRQLQGISTEVFLTTETGTSAAAIEAWLDNAYHTWDIPPVAFLLLGDYPDSGDGREVGITSPTWNNYCVSDNIYADVNGDNLPDMAHGRITARSAGELETMIGKMLDYERSPYADPGFYDHPVIAGGWQTERWFILCTEICLGHQVQVLGKNPVREYAIYSGTPGSLWSTNTNTHMLLDYFGPDGLGYIPATPGHLTDWGANATRVNNDLNAGAYMLLHRDHGYEFGWGEPDYDTGDLNNLHNTMYPFVFSINCLTGKYDISGETFTEKFHRMGYGALGLIAASEISYSFVNDTFIFGMFDGMWPEFMPDYGPYPNGPDPLRPAFGMAYGKHFLQASNWPYNTSNKDETQHLFHHHGGAFLRMYSEVPQRLTVVHDAVLYTGDDYFAMQANAGALIALTVDGQIIGVAEATGGLQDIPIAPQSEPGTMRVTLTAPNYYRYSELVPIEVSGSSVQAAFSAAPTSGCAPLQVAFTDESQGEITSWAWDFGDGGTSAAQNPSHLYADPGIRTVSLTVEGPGGTHTETKPGYISVSGPPTADFSGEPLSGSSPLMVTFTDLSSPGSTAWLWDFGDGETAATQNPVHTYTIPGDYGVTLTASNACGTDVEFKESYVHVAEPDPLAYALSDIPVAGTVSGDYLATHAADGNCEVITEVSSQTHPRKWYSMLEHRWDFDVAGGSEVIFRATAHRPLNPDGDDFAFEYSTDGASFTHLVTVAGSTPLAYAVPLPSSVSGTVYVRVVDTDRTREHQSLDAVHVDYLAIESTTTTEPPLADFSGQPRSGYAPLLVEFSDLSSGAPTAWSWDFGDGATAVAQHPSHEYAAPGYYTVSLTVTNAYGEATESKPDYIHAIELSSGTMHVHDMQVTRKQTGINVRGRCTVWIHDETDQPVMGATVTVEASGPTGGTFTGTTGEDGTVGFTTDKTRDPVGEWCFEVLDVTHATYTYNPAANHVTQACESGTVSDQLSSGEQLYFGLCPGSIDDNSGRRAILFGLARPGHVRLDVFDVTGGKVATLADDWYAAGMHAVDLDVTNLGSGVFFYRLKTADRQETRKLMSVR